MPLVQTRGAASAQGFGEFAQAATAINYIEDVFSTWLYTGNNDTNNIVNGIDLSTKGGLIWIKTRYGGSHKLTNTVNGLASTISSNLTSAASNTGVLTSFNTTGFSMGGDPGNDMNQDTVPYASWTFRKQPKFFDIQTWTGTGSNTTISHSLGSVPACILVKRTDTTGDWQVYHRSLTNTQYIVLNSTAGTATGATRWNSTTPTSTVFSIGTDATVNASGGTYVAYIFAHDAGGFGLTGTDNVISCGKFTTDGSGVAETVNLGYEPQWILSKATSSSAWYIQDIMRGDPTGGPVQNLLPNTTGAEVTRTSGDLSNAVLWPTSTGFTGTAGSNNTYIYIAIRRGPMKVPTSGTSVFGLSARSGTGANATVTGGQIDDAVIVKNRGSAVASLFSSRLTGTGYLVTSSTAAEVAAGTTILQANPWDVMDGVKVGTTSTITNASANTFINYLFKRAPSFMDVVCYTGTGSNTTQKHNLGVIPELMFVKARNLSGGGYAWAVYTSSASATDSLVLNLTAGLGTDATTWNSTAPTSSVFSIGTDGRTNDVSGTYIAYLFATCAGVSKVGSYTGNGTTQTIDCGLTAGARFVLIKITNTSGNWYVYDTARGMTTATDPYWLANTTAAEVATLGSVTTVATGFALNSTILSAINTNGGTYIYLAIA
jgi:hypothetical protein